MQLFKDTIANNNHIGKRSASDEEVITACKKASTRDFIMTLPNGYETLVGEPTSNLGILNEAVIQRSLKEEKTVQK
jgi:ATP-binding cassette subfamily C protein